MKLRTWKWNLALIFAVAALWLPGQRVFAGDAATELKALVAKINADVAAGKTTQKALAPDLKRFDVLLAEHKGQKTEAVAEILYMKAVVYDHILNDQTKAEAALKQLKTEFKGTPLVTELEQREAAAAVVKKIQDALVVGASFPEFNVTDLNGRPLSVAGDKGKVVLVDFWATWCPPCRAEVPNVVATYQKYHSKGFDIIGVSLDHDKAQLAKFIKEQNMTWPEYFDGMGWTNKLAVKYGIQAIPSNFLLDGNGKIIGKDLRGDALGQAVAAAVAKK